MKGVRRRQCLGANFPFCETGFHLLDRVSRAADDNMRSVERGQGNILERFELLV